METPASAVPVRRRIVLSIVLVGVLLVAGATTMRRLIASRPRPSKAATVALPIAVRVVPVARTSYREVITGYGRARALRATTVASEVAGLVTWVDPGLEAGVAVESGQELVRLDDRDLVQALASARARLERNAAEAVRLEAELDAARRRLEVAGDELAAARREHDRIRNLEGRAVVTQSDLDRQSMQTALREAAVVELEGRIASFAAQIDRTKADTRDLEAVLEKARLDLGRTTIRAPFAGHVEARHVARGGRVAAGTALFDLVDTARLEIPVAVPASHYGSVVVGTAARVRVTNGVAHEWAGTVARVSPSIRAEDRTFFAYIEVENGAEGARLPPGAFTVAHVDGPVHEDVYVLPRTAFVAERVYVAEEGVARSRLPVVRVELPEAVIASGGLAPGELLIVSNLEEVADGSRVSAVDASGEAEGA